MAVANPDPNWSIWSAMGPPEHWPDSIGKRRWLAEQARLAAEEHSGDAVLRAIEKTRTDVIAHIDGAAHAVDKGFDRLLAAITDLHRDVLNHHHREDGGVVA